MNLSNEKGFSLVSVMVAIGLAGGLALILMELSQQQSKQHSKALVDSELIEIYGQFNRVISKAESCGATFVGLQRGDKVMEFRYSFDENAEPFAVVDDVELDQGGKPFRKGMKMQVVEMKLLADSNNNQIYDDYENDPDPLRVTDQVAVLQVTFRRPKNVIGARVIKKIFEIPVAIGEGEMSTGATPEIVQQSCETTNDRCIASFDNYECVPDAEINNAVVPHKEGWMGYCLDKKPTNKQNEYILHCTTDKN